VRRLCGGSGRAACAPQEFDETIFEITAGRNDAVKRFGPDDEDAFIAL
jgi:hypothetical protein